LYTEEITHPLKEVDAATMAWAKTTDQVVDILNKTCCAAMNTSL